MAHSSSHKVIFHCCSDKKENSNGNTYQADCALAEPIAHLYRTSIILRASLKHQVTAEDKAACNHVPN